MESRVAARRELQQALLSWLEAARKDDAVTHACIYEDLVRAGVFAIEADAVTGEALDLHVHSDAFAVLLGALDVLADHVHLTVSQLTKDFGPGASPAIRRVSLTGSKEAEVAEAAREPAPAEYRGSAKSRRGLAPTPVHVAAALTDKLRPV